MKHGWLFALALSLGCAQHEEGTALTLHLRVLQLSGPIAGPGGRTFSLDTAVLGLRDAEVESPPTQARRGFELGWLFPLSTAYAHEVNYTTLELSPAFRVNAIAGVDSDLGTLSPPAASLTTLRLTVGPLSDEPQKEETLLFEGSTQASPEGPSTPFSLRLPGSRYVTLPISPALALSTKHRTAVLNVELHPERWLADVDPSASETQQQDTLVAAIASSAQVTEGP